MDSLIEEFKELMDMRERSGGTTFDVVNTFEHRVKKGIRTYKTVRRMRVPKQGIPHNLIVGNEAYRHDGLIYVVEDFESDRVVKILKP